jgi:hypothetical protein
LSHFAPSIGAHGRPTVPPNTVDRIRSAFGRQTARHLQRPRCSAVAGRLPRGSAEAAEWMLTAAPHSACAEFDSSSGICAVKAAPPPNRNPALQGFPQIGAPGFEPGTSPTRITRAPRPGKQEIPANRAFWLFGDGRQAPQPPGYSGGLPGIGHRHAQQALRYAYASPLPLRACVYAPQARLTPRNGPGLSSPSRRSGS